MTSGLRYEEFPPWGDPAATYYAPDLRASALSARVVEPAGQTFLYFGGRIYEDSALALMLSGDFQV